MTSPQGPPPLAPTAEELWGWAGLGRTAGCGLQESGFISCTGWEGNEAGGQTEKEQARLLNNTKRAEDCSSH